MGLQALSEIFADRAYMDDLSLVPQRYGRSHDYR